MIKNTSKLIKDKRTDVPKFVLISEIDTEKEKVSALKDVISLIWDKVGEASSDKQLEFIKRKIHSDFMNHIPRTFEGTMKDWMWDILFNNKK